MGAAGFSLLVVAAVTVGLGVFVLVRSPGVTLTRAFAYFLFTAAAWAAAVAGVIHSPALPYVQFAGQCAFAGGILAISGFCAFVLIFTEGETPPGRRRLVRLIYSLGALFAVLSMTRLVFQEPDMSTHPPMPVRGPLFLPYAVLAVVLTVGAIARLLWKLTRTSNPRERLQISYMIAGGVMSCLVSVILVFALPALDIDQFSTLAPLSLLGMVAGTALAISKHRLFHLGVVFRQASIACGVALVLTVLIFVLLSLTRATFGDAPGLMMGGLVATATAAGLLLPGIRRIVEYAVDTLIFGGPPTDTRALLRLSQELTTLLSVEPLAELLVSGIGKALRLHHVSLYMADVEPDDAVRFWSVQATWPADHPALPEIPADSPLIELTQGHEGPLIADLARHAPASNRGDVHQLQARLEADVVFPLKAEGQTLGLLVLSEKLHGDLLSDAELGLLSTMVHQASTALANAILHEEILRMKVHNDNILRGMVSGVIAVDKRGLLSTCNRRAAELLGRAAPEVEGHDENVLPAALAEPLRDARLFGRTVRRLRVELPTAAGETISVALLANGMHDASGKTIGALLVFEDLTERLRLEDQVRRADRLASLGTLAAGLAHEIKNPLVSIRTLAQLLPTRYDDPEFRETFVQLAGGEVERINDLVERLLVFAKPSPPSLEWLHLEPIVDDVLQLMGAELHSHGVEVVRTYGEPHAWLYADQAQMRQVLLNLFMNALDAMRDTGTRRLTVQLSAGAEEEGQLAVPDHWTSTGETPRETGPVGEAGRLTLTVSDTGAGIPEDLREEIFNPFFTTKAHGSGLGLAVVGRIVREHGGVIAVENTPAGGAHLVVHFPATIAVPDPAPVS